MNHLLISSTLLVTAYASLVCPDGYTLILDKCLKAMPNALTHTKAEADCTYVGGTLVNVHSAIENRAIADFASKSGINKTWLGLFCFSNQNASSCYYDDNFGTSSIYNNFASGYPRIDGISGGCVYMSTEGSLAGKWVNVKCEAEDMPFVCEMPSSSYDPTCNHNYNGYCYIPSTELNAVYTTFSDAQSICQEKHSGSLASIHSKRENDYIFNMFRGTTGYVLLGGQHLLPNTFSWVDGSDFAGFDNRDPLDTGSQDCLGIDRSNGLWKRIDCTAKLIFLCKRPLPGTVVPTPPAELVTVDPSDFSNCNSTFVMAPGAITSYGYLNTTPSVEYCTWRIVSLGAYRVRLSFTDVDTYNYVSIYDEYGNNLGSISISNRAIIAPTNIVNVTFQASGRAGYRGFRAVAMPY